MPSTYEINQATGARAGLIYNKESDWGVLGSAAWRAMRLLGGETLDQNLTLYRSAEIRDDRGKNGSVRGSQKPAGQVPFELSPRGWSPLLWHLLGGSVTTTAGPIDAVQSITITGTPTGGTFTLSFMGQTTAAIAYNAIASVVQTALQGLSTIGASNITCSGGALPGTPVVCTFAAGLAGTNVAQINVNANNLTGGTTPLVFTQVTTEGVLSSNYRHVFKGSTSLPTGFTLEKQFNDVDSGAKGFFSFLGCRVDKMTLRFAQDTILTGAFDIIMRQASDPAIASLNSGGAPTRPTDDPFTSSQIQILEGATLLPLGVTEELSMTIANNFYVDRGYVLGSVFASSMKPGDRDTTATARFKFNNTTLLEKATAGTSTKLRAVAKSGQSAVIFDFLQGQFLPVNAWPKVVDSGPISIDANFEGQISAAAGSDIQCTLIVPEPDITV